MKEKKLNGLLGNIKGVGVDEEKRGKRKRRRKKKQWTSMPN